MMNFKFARRCVLLASLAAAIPAIAGDGAPFASSTSTAPAIYSDGTFSWPGDWSGDYVTLNYHDKSGDPGTEDLSVHVNTAWGFWLPYCPQVGPDIDGYKVPSCDVSPYSAITLRLKATVTGQTWGLTIYKYNVVDGVLKDDSIVGGVDDLTPYGGPSEVGQFVTYTVPLADMKASGLKTMYKLMLQDQTGKTGQRWFVNDVSFVK